MQSYITAIQESFLYGIMAIGIFVSLRILNIPDLTAEGSFGLGMAVAAVVTVEGHRYLSLLAATLIGVFAGFLTALLQTKLGVHPVISGIIVMSGAYSVKLIIMNNVTNVAMGNQSIFKVFRNALGKNTSALNKKIYACLLCLAIAAVVVGIMIWFFKTHLGMCVRAVGNNPEMVKASSINADRQKIIGLCIANGLIGLSGGLIAHYFGASDVSYSNGVLVYGLASVIIGEAIFGKKSVTAGVISAVVGSMIYKIIVTFVIKLNIFGSYGENLMKLMCALLVAITLSVPAIRKNAALRKTVKEAKRNVGD